MEEYTCIFYETTAGKLPVEEFIESLDQGTQDKFILKKQLLQDFGPQLRYPHTDRIGEGIFELRFKGKEGRRKNNIVSRLCKKDAENSSQGNRDCQRKKEGFFIQTQEGGLNNENS